MTYLTRDECAAICGTALTSYATMSKRLQRIGIPHVARPGMCPLVSRAVVEAMLSGEKRAHAKTGPNFAALRGIAA